MQSYGGVHFKPNPKALDFLGVAQEFAVHSLGNILTLGDMITAPTTLLKISNVALIKPNKKQKNQEGFKALTTLMLKGDRQIDSMLL